jgi:two-component system copper resistance phosphate regulon response regulator CusR
VRVAQPNVLAPRRATVILAVSRSWRPGGAGRAGGGGPASGRARAPRLCGRLRNAAQRGIPLRILVIEDDRKIASFLERGLREDGYAVDVAHDGNQGATHAHVHDYDLLIVDIMLPGRNGFEIVRELRAAGRTVPILLLTARDASQDVVRGLDVGADDYVTKPFRFDELLARVRALVRRGGAARTERLIYADLELDRLKREVHRAGVPLDLTPREFQLLEKVWDLHFDPMTNVVDVHVAHLRRKLHKAGGPPLIHTVRGVGYVLNRVVP